MSDFAYLRCALRLQTTARRNAIPIDTLAFEYGIVNLEEREINAAPKEGVYVKGMFLEGMCNTSPAGWIPRIAHAQGSSLLGLALFLESCVIHEPSVHL